MVDVYQGLYSYVIYVDLELGTSAEKKEAGTERLDLYEDEYEIVERKS